MVIDWHKIKKDFFLASFSQFVYKVVGYLVLTILTRYLTKGEMGEFFFAASLASFFALLTQLGTDNYIVRETANKSESALKYLSDVVSIRIILFAIYLFLLNGFTLIFKFEAAETVFLTSIYVLFEQFYSSIGSLFLAVKRIKYNVIAGVGTRIFLVGMIYFAVKMNGGLQFILFCYIAANALLLTTAFFILFRKFGRVNLSWNTDQLRKVLRLSFPFFILSALILIHFKIDSIMLGFMKPYTVVAVYEASYKLFEASHFLTMPFGMIFLPIFSRMAFNENWNEIRIVMKKIFTIMSIVGSVLTITILLFSGDIINFIFGSKYSDSIPVLRILYLTVPVYYVVNLSILLSKSIFAERKAIKVILICTVINIAVNSVVIPVWGAIGAAWTTFASETLLMILLVRLNANELRNLSATISANYVQEPDHAG